MSTPADSEPASTPPNGLQAPATPATDASAQGRLVAQKSATRWSLGEARPAEAGRWTFRFEDGMQRESSGLATNMAWVVHGSMLHQVAADPEGARERFAQEPAEVVVTVLRDSRTALNKADIERRLQDLLLVPEQDWWPKVSKSLRAHAHVLVEGPRYAWSEAPLDKTVEAVAKKPRTPRKGGPVTVRQVGDPEQLRDPEVAGTTLPPQADTPARPIPPAVEPSEAPAAVTATLRDTGAKDSAMQLRHVMTHMNTPDARPLELDANLSGVLAGTAADSPESLLARALQGALHGGTTLDLSPLDIGAMATSLRRDVGLFALRTRAFAAFVRVVVASDRLEAGRLLSAQPLSADAVLAWSDLIGQLRNLDLRTTDRTESVLRRLSEELVDPADDSELVTAAVTLLGTLSRPVLDMKRGLAIAGRYVLEDCLRATNLDVSLGTVSTAVLSALSTGPLLADDGRLSSVRTSWLLALDRAGRADVLAAAAVWSGVSLSELAVQPALAEVLDRRRLTAKVATQVTAAAESPLPRDLVRLLALPDAMLSTVSQHALARRLESIRQEDTAFGRSLQLFRERLVDEVEQAVREQLSTDTREQNARVVELTEALDQERSEQAQARQMIETLRAQSRAAEAQSLQQVRLQSLKLVVDLLEEVRLATLAAPNDHLSQLQHRLAMLAEAAGVKAEGVADEVLGFDPSRHRVIAVTSGVDAGAAVVVLRPVYVLSDGGSTTVLRSGEVRPADNDPAG